MKVWITKYALSSGIKELEVEQSESNPDLVCGEAWNDVYCGEEKNWHRTHEAAIAKAEEMRQKQIASLKKQIEKLEKKKFKVREDSRLEPEKIKELRERSEAQKIYKPNPNIYCCPACGEKIDPMWDYCPWCGQHVTDY